VQKLREPKHVRGHEGQTANQIPMNAKYETVVLGISDITV